MGRGNPLNTLFFIFGAAPRKKRDWAGTPAPPPTHQPASQYIALPQGESLPKTPTTTLSPLTRQKRRPPPFP